MLQKMNKAHDKNWRLFIMDTIPFFLIYIFVVFLFYIIFYRFCFSVTFKMGYNVCWIIADARFSIVVIPLIILLSLHQKKNDICWKQNVISKMLTSLCLHSASNIVICKILLTKVYSHKCWYTLLITFLTFKIAKYFLAINCLYFRR